MKILWIVNVVFQQVADACGLESSAGGGWLSGFFESMKNKQNYNISVCFPYSGQRIKRKTSSVNYYSFIEKSLTKYDDSLEMFFSDIITEEMPDVIHIFGTEFPHTLAAVKACKNMGVLERCVINIQGLISACAEQYYAGLSNSAIYKCSIRDFLKADNVYFQKKNFEKRGIFEINALKIAKNVIGRTDWDLNLIKSINPDINYYFCNESLRSEFYEDPKWDYEKCEKYSIFVPQSYYPLKGFHNLISIFAEVTKKYPDTHIYTTGNGGDYHNFLLNLRHQTYYQKYLLKLIKKYNLKDKISFLGNLNASEMRERLLKSNVFLLASSIENSSNSLGEAMLLGVPSISSNVGGIKTLMTHNKEGFLYPFDKPETINLYIDKIFSDIDKANEISGNAVKRAEHTHSRTINEKVLNEIYLDISKHEESI